MSNNKPQTPMRAFLRLHITQALHEVEMIISIMESNLLTKVIFYKQIKFYKLAEKYIRTGN
jgi:hypothetical protein